MHPWKEHSFLRRRSWRTQKFRGSSIPKTCGYSRRPAGDTASSLRPKSGLTGPLELAGPIRKKFGIARNPGPEPPRKPNEKSHEGVSKMYFQCLRGPKKWDLTPKHRLKSTASATTGTHQGNPAPGHPGASKNRRPFRSCPAPRPSKPPKNLQISWFSEPWRETFNLAGEPTVSFLPRGG